MRNFFFILIFTSLIVSCSQESITKCPEQNSKRPAQAINYEEAASMFKTYDNGQKKVLDEYIIKRSRGKDSISTVSIFFEIDELKQYIAYIERLSKEKEIELTGIRIFNAAYPADYEKEEYQNRTTTILFPTANIGDKKNIAYEPLESGIKKPVSMQSILKHYMNNKVEEVNEASFLFNLQGGGRKSSGLNRGVGAPPF